MAPATFAQGLAKIYLALRVRGQILDQQGARTAAQIALDLGVAAKALRLLLRIYCIGRLNGRQSRRQKECQRWHRRRRRRRIRPRFRE